MSQFMGQRHMRNFHRWLVGVIPLMAVLPLLATAQQPPQAPVAQGPTRGTAASTDEGIPVTDADVVKACGGCHVDRLRSVR